MAEAENTSQLPPPYQVVNPNYPRVAPAPVYEGAAPGYQFQTFAPTVFAPTPPVFAPTAPVVQRVEQTTQGAVVTSQPISSRPAPRDWSSGAGDCCQDQGICE